jgi:hypothetical protein
MKFLLAAPRKESLYTVMRRAGYRFERKSDNELIFSRIIGGQSGYPRFHLYITVQESALLFSLHLDQKKPIYKGASAHAGEYSGEIVEREAQRIQNEINNFYHTGP